MADLGAGAALAAAPALPDLGSRHDIFSQDPAAEAAQLRQDPATVDRGTDRPRRGREAERLRRELNDLD